VQNMEGEEERGSVGEENSQKDAAADETSRQTECSQTPQLRSDRGSDDDDDKEDEREEQTSGSLWGHARLPPSVYGNNPPPGGKRMGKANAVWEVVKHLKERTVDGEVVDAKYSHVCISPITAAEAGEQGPDVDSHGNSLWFCNKLFSLSKTKNCYRSSQATKHCGQFHGETECTAALKRWVAYGRDLDFTPYLKERVTEHAAGKAPDIVVLDTDVSAVEQKNYDFMGDLLEADILMLFRQVLRQEESLVKVGGQAQFGYLPRMALANIGAMNGESFCERILSCVSLVVTYLHTSLDHEEVRMLTMLRMNKSLMEYMRKEYDNLHSHIEASETRITKQLRDKAEVQAQEAATMDEEY